MDGMVRLGVLRVLCVALVVDLAEWILSAVSLLPNGTRLEHVYDWDDETAGFSCKLDM